MILKKDVNISIVIPIDATLREKFAAEELKKYVEMIFCTDIIITDDSKQCFGNVFLIGGPERNIITKSFISEEDFDDLVPGPEGMLIKSFNDETILIAGSSKNVNECERGTLYGVYEFLERFLDCTLAAFSDPDLDAGEIVPRQDAVEIRDIFYCKGKSDRTYRAAIVQYSNSAGNPDRELNIPFFDWLIKNRYNRILTWSSIYQFYKENGLLEEAEKRGLRFTVGHHESSRLFLPAYGNKYFSEKYYETHPEYFKLLENGERFINSNPEGQWVFCSRNEDAINTVAKNIIIWLEQNPSVDIVALWPNDGISEQCCCPNCKPYTKEENYCYFVGAVAKKVREKYPYIKFDMLIYVDLWECPKGILLDDSYLINESTLLPDGLRTMGRPDGSCLNGTPIEENILAWKNTGADVVYYDYYMGVYALRQRLLPMADEVQSIWKNFIDKGIMGAGTQIECYNMWNHLFNYYTFGRTGYDVSLTLADNAKAFCKLFGNGSEEIMSILFMLEECMDGQPEKDFAHFLMEHIDKDKVYDLYEKALAKAETKRFRNNIRLLRMVFRYTDIETQEKLSKRVEFHPVVEDYEDETGELAKMAEYDSFWKNNPGYAIMIPVKSNKKNFVTNKWYEFE